MIANPRQVRLIAEARIKADRTDATVLAQLCASGFLPEVPDETTLGLRRQVMRRTRSVRQWVRPKTIAQSILHAHLVPPCPHAALSESKGRVWLLAQALLPDEGDATARHLREHDRLAEDWKVVERELANCAQANQRDAASGVRPVPTARRELVRRNDGASSRRRSPIGAWQRAGAGADGARPLHRRGMTWSWSDVPTGAPSAMRVTTMGLDLAQVRLPGPQCRSRRHASSCDADYGEQRSSRSSGPFPPALWVGRLVRPLPTGRGMLGHDVRLMPPPASSRT